MITHAPITPTKRTSTLMAQRRTEHYGVARRVCGSTEPGYVVYRGEGNAETVAHFFNREGKDGADEYVRWKNSKE